MEKKYTKMEYTLKQGDFVRYSIVNQKNQVLKGTGTIVGIAANPTSFSDTIYMVKDPEVFPNTIYPYTTVPMYECNLEKIGHLEDEYIYIDKEGENVTITSYGQDYHAAKARLLANKNGRITKVMNHNLGKIFDDPIYGNPLDNEEKE